MKTIYNQQLEWIIRPSVLRLALLAATFAACHDEPSRAPQPQGDRQSQMGASSDDVQDLAELQQAGHPAYEDIEAVIKETTPQLARCADAVRGVVKLRRAEGFGRVGIIVTAQGKREHKVQLRDIEVPDVFPPEYGFPDCVRKVLMGTLQVSASADYNVRSRVHLCIQPERP